MTSLADKVARFTQAGGVVLIDSDTTAELVGIIRQLWDENQKQREVLGMARDALVIAPLESTGGDYLEMREQTLTAIDNVSEKGE